MNDHDPPRDAWTVLGLPSTATTAQAERAHRRLTRRDRSATGSGADPSGPESGTELTAAIEAIRTGSASRPDEGGWWRGAAPADGIDWFGLPLGPVPPGEPSTADGPPPVPCPLCDEPFTRANELRTHLAAVHQLRPTGAHRPLLDRLDTIAWRTPVWLVALLAALAAVVVAVPWAQTEPRDSAWAVVRSGALVAGTWLATTMVLELLVERHRRRLDRAARWAAIRGMSGGR